MSDLARAERMYCAGLGFSVMGRFQDHQGFDGVMIGHAGMDYHFEFTQCQTAPVTPAPTHEDLLVLYVADEASWQSACERLDEHGFVRVPSFNPYWDVSGQTFEDFDGYRTVLQNAAWPCE